MARLRLHAAASITVASVALITVAACVGSGGGGDAPPEVPGADGGGAGQVAADAQGGSTPNGKGDASPQLSDGGAGAGDAGDARVDATADASPPVGPAVNFAADFSPFLETTEPDLGTHDPIVTGTFTYYQGSHDLCGVVTYTDLTGAPTGLHIHQAPAGDPDGDGLVKKDIVITASPVKFRMTLDTSFAASLEAGEIYANIHTAMNTKGESRSTLFPDDQQATPNVICP